MQSLSSRIWTRIVVSNSYDDNHYTTGTSITLKNMKLENARLWWNTWFLAQEIHLHSRQTSTRNEQMPTKSTRTRMDDQSTQAKNCLKQLQTHNLPTDNVNIISSTNKERDLLLANKAQIVPRGPERMPQRIQRHSRVTLHRLAHPKRRQDQTEKSS